MKRIFISLLLLLLCLSVVSCSAAKESEELDFSLASIEASAGKILFEDKTVILGAEGAEVKLKYGFYVNEYVHKGTVSEYRIVFRIGESEYSVDYTDGPYDANEFVYIGDYNSGDFDFPKEETVVIPREFFRESNGSINIEIRGIEGDGTQEQALTAYKIMYYQMLGNSVMISSRALPMHSDLQLEFKYKADGYSTDNSQAYERYEPSFAKRTLIKYPIDCFAVGEYDTGIAVDGVSQISKYVMIGARVSDKKIRLECYNIDSEKNEAALERAVTLKYSGDYSIEYHSGGAIARYSDDGEPQGTAGMPVLNVVKLSGATDLCVVVTRYFGGILLGAGGLVRAYSASAKQAVDAAGLAVFEDYAVMQIKVSYSDYQKLTIALQKLGASEDSCDFGEDVSVLTAIEKTREDEIRQTVSELTYGKGQVTVIGYEERASRIRNG